MRVEEWIRPDADGHPNGKYDIENAARQEKTIQSFENSRKRQLHNESGKLTVPVNYLTNRVNWNLHLQQPAYNELLGAHGNAIYNVWAELILWASSEDAYIWSELEARKLFICSELNRRLEENHLRYSSLKYETIRALVRCYQVESFRQRRRRRTCNIVWNNENSCLCMCCSKQFYFIYSMPGYEMQPARYEFHFRS